MELALFKISVNTDGQGSTINNYSPDAVFRYSIVVSGGLTLRSQLCLDTTVIFKKKLKNL